MSVVKRCIAVIAALVFAFWAVAARCAPAPDSFELAAQPVVHVTHSESSKGFRMAVSSSNRGMWESMLLPSLVRDLESLDHAFKNSDYKKRVSLRDPVAHAKEKVAEGLRKALELTNLNVVADPMSAAALDALKQKNESGLLLSVSTENWGLEGYRARYSAEARLIKLPDSRELWSGRCPAILSNTVEHKKMQPASDEEAQALVEQLLANDGALIKDALRESAERCGGMLARLLLAAKPRVDPPVEDWRKLGPGQLRNSR